MTSPEERLQSWVDEDPDVHGETWPAPLDVQAVLDDLKATRASLAHVTDQLWREANRHAASLTVLTKVQGQLDQHIEESQAIFGDDE